MLHCSSCIVHLGLRCLYSFRFAVSPSQLTIVGATVDGRFVSSISLKLPVLKSQKTFESMYCLARLAVTPKHICIYGSCTVAGSAGAGSLWYLSIGGNDNVLDTALVHICCNLSNNAIIDGKHCVLTKQALFPHVLQ